MNQYNWQGKNVILFDGVCNLCNGLVNFVIDRDPKAYFYFASLQSETGQSILAHFQLPQTDFDTMVFVSDEGKLYTKSSAALNVLKGLGSIWKLCYAGIILPPFIRDAAYSLLAQNRYKLFGKTEQCRMPSPELKQRFL